MKKILIVDYEKGDMTSYIDMTVIDGKLSIKHGESVKVTEFTPPTDEEITKQYHSNPEHGEITKAYVKGWVSGMAHFKSLLT